MIMSDVVMINAEAQPLQLSECTIIGHIPSNEAEHPVIVDLPGESTGVYELSEILKWMATDQKVQLDSQVFRNSPGPLSRSMFNTSHLVAVKFPSGPTTVR